MNQLARAGVKLTIDDPHLDIGILDTQGRGNGREINRRVFGAKVCQAQ